MLSIEELFNITKGKWLKKRSSISKNNLKGVCFDSRIYEGESIFIALKNKNNDGHNYIQHLDDYELDVIIVSKPVSITNKTASYLLVDNTNQTLMDVAKYVARKFSGIIISVTGSNGKTSFKKWLSIVLSEKFKVLSSKKSYNNNIGLPATILATDEDTEVLILEVGTNNNGEINKLSSIAQANIATLLNVGMAHIGKIGSIEKIYKEKLAIFKYLKEPYLAVYPKDDRRMVIPNYCKKLTFNDQCIQLGYNYDKGIFNYLFKIYKKNIKTQCKLIGEHIPESLSAIIVISQYLGLSEDQIISGINKLSNLKGRLQILKGIRNTIIINDCYNANPNSLVNLLKTIKHLNRFNKKILVLGELAELGDHISNAIKYVLPYLKNEIDIILAKGNFAKAIKEYEPNLNIHIFQNDKLLIKAINEQIVSNSIISFKGSRVSQLENIMENFIK